MRHVDEIDSIISAELPRPGEDDELRALVLKHNKHRHSAYCGNCKFNYNTNVVTPETYIDETTNRVVYRRREEEDLMIVPYNAKLTKRFRAHINVERTQGGGSVAYLMKYTFKVCIPKEVRVRTANEEPQANAPQIRNDVRMYQRSRVIGAVEAAWNLFEFRHVRIKPNIEPYGIHLPGERTFLISNPNAPAGTKMSPLQRYFARPSEFVDMEFLTYYESVRLYDKLPRSLQGQADDILQDSGTPPMYIVPRAEEDEAIGRIRFASPSNVELFALRLILLHKPASSFEDARTFDGELYSTYRMAAVAMGLYIDGDEFDKAFDEAVTMHATPGELRFMVVTLYQQGGDPEKIINNHGDVVGSRAAQQHRPILGKPVVTSPDRGGRSTGVAFIDN